MNFRTELTLKPATGQIGLQQSILTIGSCFADAIGNRLVNYKFNCVANPFGTLYNPASIHKVLHYCLAKKSPASDSFIERDGVLFNYDFHSEVAGLNHAELTTEIDSRLKKTAEALKTADYLFITYGSAWVYQRKDTGELVANCHKVNASAFTKTLLTCDDIIQSFEHLREQVVKVNPLIKFILTVSPVRHIKDTIELNSVSKSTLRLACHEIKSRSAAVEYFPAYEIMLDDLRDYRFYKSDLLHPTEFAEDYIWGKFGDRYFSEETRSLIKKWNSIRAAMLHKPFQTESAGHQQFLRDTLQKLEELKSAIDVSQEIAHLKQTLQNF